MYRAPFWADVAAEVQWNKSQYCLLLTGSTTRIWIAEKTAFVDIQGHLNVLMGHYQTFLG